MGELEPLVLFVILALVIAAVMVKKKWKGGGWSHGTARIADKNDLKDAGMLSGDGLPLGRVPSTGELVRLNSFTHLAIFAPTGAGKGVSLSIPWLLDWAGGSVVVNDPKAELVDLTGRRRRELKQTVAVLDPFRVSKREPSASLNVLDLIDSGDECIDAARSLANSMVIRAEASKDPHWDDQAENVICSMLILILKKFEPAERNLSSLRELVTAPGMYEEVARKLLAMGGLCARYGGTMLSMEAKERSGVLSSVNRHTAWLDSPAISSCVESSTFDLRGLLRGDTSLFLVLPPDQLEAQSRWLRGVIASIIRLVGREHVSKGKSCLMLLDEAGQLGHMPALDQGLTLLRGMGLKLAFFFQSLGQLKQSFRDREAVLLDNTEHVYFGTQSLETAEKISKQLGQTTIVVESANEGGSRSWSEGLAPQNAGQSSRNDGRSWQEVGRALMTPEEILTCPPSALFAFLKGVPPLLLSRILYYSDPAFSSLTGGGGGWGGVVGNGRRLWLWALLLSALAFLLWLASQ